METDMALSEFPAFADNNANQPSSHTMCTCYLKSALPVHTELCLYSDY